ncbi:MAG: hypothetical protein OIN87_03690 [Candidatus Methanoperedens sp.]|nr:hypothetical protein [Candidatus Methanoperedens sp.]
MVSSSNKVLLISSIIAGVIVVLLVSVTALLYFSGEKQIDPGLERSVRNEYSVPVDVKIIQTPDGNIAYIIPGSVRWDARHEKLLYNLSDPREATLAIVETFANQDVQALENVTSQDTLNAWIRQGYTTTRMMELYRADFKNIDKPYRFELDRGEDDPAEDRLSVRIIREMDELHLEINKQIDGKWKI